MGFMLTKIEGYASLAISKVYSFRKVLCAFLMNLRSGKRGPSFMDRLSKEELKDVREVVRRSQPLLEALRNADTKLDTMPELLENRVAALQNLVPGGNVHGCFLEGFLSLGSGQDACGVPTVRATSACLPIIPISHIFPIIPVSPIRPVIAFTLSSVSSFSLSPFHPHHQPH